MFYKPRLWGKDKTCYCSSRIPFDRQYSVGTSSVNDVALIKLKKPIDLGCTKLKPICLAEKDYTNDLFVIGWGLQDCEARSDILRLAKVSTVGTKYLRSGTLTLLNIFAKFAGCVRGQFKM